MIDRVLEDPVIDYKAGLTVVDQRPKYSMGQITPSELIDDNASDDEFWGQFRGDYLDLRDFVQMIDPTEKRDWLMKKTKEQATLLREHLLLLWTYNEENREILTNELLIINRVMYNDNKDI
jgi:hypothetical protein